MNHDPILATKTLPADRQAGRRHPHTFTVHGGLNYLQGNDKPYFSLTYAEHRQGFPNQEESGGAGHETILQHFPEFADLAALHLSDNNGAPMHAEDNGWYQLAGALGGFGEKYHVGNSEGHYPLPADRLDPDKPYITTEYRQPTRDECLASFARHCRITVEEARMIVAKVDPAEWRLLPLENFQARAFPTSQAGKADLYIAACRGRWAAICEAMRPRWKAEALACIAHHGLQVYGDPWGGDYLHGARREGEAMPRTCHDALPGEGRPAIPHLDPEPTYIDTWGITSTAAKVDRNPNMDGGENMDHWRVTLHRGRRRMTVYYSMGSAHAGHEPTAQEVIDCIAQDAAGIDGQDFETWASDLGYDPDSRRAHRTYTICRRQGERLRAFLGADRYDELLGGE